MSTRRTHSVTTSDGVVIRGTVHGQGPPVVLLQGVLGDGDTDWQALHPHLTRAFTCHLPSWRGRGLSGDHPDLSFGRLVDDMIAYVDSVSEPSRLVGWSGGAGLALAVAARTDTVVALAPVEPSTPRFMTTQEQAELGAAVARMGELAAQGRLPEAARAFARFVFTDQDIAEAEQVGYFDATARYVPHVLDFFGQLREYDGPTHEDPAVLAAISAPALVMVGSDTKSYATDYAAYVADHVATATVAPVPGAGHAAPLTHPEALAGALATFFASVQEPT